MSRVTRRVDLISDAIVTVRGLRGLLDEDLARLYGVATKALNQAVQRNAARFPRDFMFRLTRAEAARLRSQIVTSSGHGGRRHPPLMFTEQGVAMLSSVLRSSRAVSVNIEIMRAFVRQRRAADASADLTRRIDELEDRYDGQFAHVFTAIRRLMTPPSRTLRRIGFK